MVSIKNMILEMLHMFQVFNTSFTNIDFLLYREHVGTKLAQPSRFGDAISSKTTGGCIF